MKKALIVLALVASSLTVSAQVGVGPDEYFFKDKVSDFEEGALEQLRASKTVFLFGDKDDSTALSAVIKSVWTLTDINLLHYTQADSIDFSTTSVFSFEELLDNDNSISLQLWMKNTNKRGKTSKVSYAQIRLHANNLFKITEELAAIRNKAKSKKAETAYAYLYDENRFDNTNVGFLKNYLKTINEALTDSSTLSPFSQITNHADLIKLKSATILIPDYAATNFNSTTNVYEDFTAEDIEKLFDNYDFKYEIVNNDILNQRILDGQEIIYYMVYVRTLSTQQITIYNSKTGAIIYNIYDRVANNLSASDFKALNKAIEKSEK